LGKLLVTHFYPDLDGITAIWLFRRFGGKHFENCAIEFVSAGTTWNDQPSDSDPDVIHVDTGLGLFDHHLSNEYTCAAKKVYEHLCIEDEALASIVEYVTQIDHFRDVNWPDTLSDIYDFGLHNIISGWKVAYPQNQHKDYVEWGLICLDGVYQSLSGKQHALKSVEENGFEFESVWGSGLAIQTFNDEVIKTGLKMGYSVVVRRDPAKHYIRIKGRPDRDDIDLTVIYEKLIALDPEATWFLHADKKQLLNGNTKNPKNVYTKLNLDDVIEILKVK
jgi:hypothetical protein